jgi:hypothetical protein
VHFDAARIRWPEWVVGIGGLVLLASMLLVPWYSLPTFSGPPGPPIEGAPNKVDGWNGLTNGHWLVLVAILLALATIVTQARRGAPAVPATLTLLASWLGGITFLYLVYRVIINPPGGRGLGGWIGLIAAGAIAYGGYRSVRMEGIAPRDAPRDIPVIKLGDEAAT